MGSAHLLTRPSYLRMKTRLALVLLSLLSASCSGRPQKSVPQESVFKESVSKEFMPDVSMPDVSMPEESIPEESIPEESIPEESKPEESIPEESVSKDSVSIVGPGVRVVKKGGERKNYTVCQESSIVNSHCNASDYCVVYCSDGSEHNVDCEGQGSSFSSSGDGGTTIECGVSVEFDDCFPFCGLGGEIDGSGDPGNDDLSGSGGGRKPIVSFPKCFPFCDNGGNGSIDGNRRNSGNGSKDGHRKPLVSFPKCFPFCDNSNFSKFVNGR